MRQRHSWEWAAPASRTPDVLGCFDAGLRIRRNLFDDAVAVCNIPVECSPVVPVGHPATLRFGERVVDLAAVLGWLAECGGWTFYLHHHDNIVAELARIEPYERAAFCRGLQLFRTRPASEGGSNLLGVVGPSRAWVLVLENDNQGGFRIDFFGPAAACRDLRLKLGQQRPVEPGAAADGGA
ncbi:MAG: hypothetical protein JWM11_5208 [Planctomycetaceae bacterium]|nr:hypothetical protein [Planctomycetaceae bacterium]